MVGRCLALGVTAITCGCIPGPAWHLGETAAVHPRGEVSVTAAGGVGPYGATDLTENNLNGGASVAAGGSVRVRVGVGHRQEVGVEASAAYPGAYSALVRWKIAPRDWLALVADVGGTIRPGPAIGTDVALVFSSTGPRVRVYGGPRVGISELLSAYNFSETLTLAIGAWYQALPRVALFVEMGPVVGFSHTSSHDYAAYGGYIAVGVSGLVRQVAR